MNKTMIKYTHFEIDGEQAIVYNGDVEVDRVDLCLLVEAFLEDSDNHIQED